MEPIQGREIHDHKVNGLNEAIVIQAGPPGPGGASHVYTVDLMANPGRAPEKRLIIDFQNGPIQEVGFNGFSNEMLLAVVIDRLRGFQSGKFACRENAIALTSCEEALMWLQKRTRDRIARGVEGTLKA